MTDSLPLTIEDPWPALKQFTPARIALGHTGVSLPTQAYLDFQLAHALARDAVSIPLDFDRLEQRLNGRGYQTLLLQTQAESHQSYLQRPDLGRRLNSAAVIKVQQAAQYSKQPDIAVIVADGLSSTAIENHAEAFLDLLLPQLLEKGYSRTPVCLVKHGRVSCGDPVAEIFAALMCIVLIGERPGLSSPDSMGIYFTYRAKSGCTDADRNCISNIHKNGLSYQQALHKLLFLIGKADQSGFSGVLLKDESTDSSVDRLERRSNFLLE